MVLRIQTMQPSPLPFRSVSPQVPLPLRREETGRRRRSSQAGDRALVYQKMSEGMKGLMDYEP